VKAPPPRHPAQQRILAAVADRPGLCLQDLAKELGITRTATLHHVRRLAREGLIHTARHGRRVLHFQAAAQPPPTLLGLLHVHTARLVVELLSQDPGASWRKLAKQLGITPRAVRWHIRKLEGERALHVQPSRFGPGHVTVLSPALRSLMGLDAPLAAPAEPALASLETGLGP
jgi:predicted ArsR family transcriptional regulator